MQVFFLPLIAYFIGAIPSGVVLTRLAGTEDVRNAGSGNIGATNVYRVAGKRLGILTLVLDILKGLLPMLLVKVVLGATATELALVAVALFIGHCYPVYLRFKGGKGVATALGIYLVVSPLAVLAVIVLFAAIVWKWRYVSLGSIVAAAVVPLLVYAGGAAPAMLLATLLISGGVIYRHHGNIKRLLNGTENRFKE